MNQLRSESHKKHRLENREKLEKLRESLRSIVEKNRQGGNLRSTAPDLKNMTAGQILLEALSKPDWPDKLQSEGIKVDA
jgi:hypothetical protein